jgi:hypothetical protein
MDISEQISALLNSPDGMDKIRSVAASLLGGDGDKESKKTSESPSSNLPDLLQNAESMGNIMRLMSLLQNRSEDKRVALLLALRPHLSNEKRARVDKAISLLKVASLLPILREEGLLDSIF